MGIDFMSQLEIGSLEALCVQYIESSICQENVLVALDSAARLQLDPLKVQTLILGLQPSDKAAKMGVKTKEYFLEEFT